MAATAPPPLSLSTLNKQLVLKLKPLHTSTLSALPSKLSSNKTFHLHIHQKHTQTWRISAAPQDTSLSELANPPPPFVDNSQQIVTSTPTDPTVTIIQALLFIAFVGLSILTIGVVYIAVTDYLQKRETEKFAKEEATKKKSGKKGKVRARPRGAPRGFGQKIEEEEDF